MKTKRKHSWRVGWFLAYRQIMRSSPWTTLLIVAVMTLTFLNLVVVGGILVGLIEGSSIAYRKQYSGDVIIRNTTTREYIVRTNDLENFIHALPEVSALTTRYITGASIEANYKKVRKAGEVPGQVGTNIVGIDPYVEDAVTGYSGLVTEGEYLDPSKEGYILLGKNLLSKYSSVGPGLRLLDDVEVGDRVRVTVGKVQKEFIVKGVLASKIGDVSLRAFITDSELRKMIGRTDRNADEIVLKLAPGASPEKVRDVIKASGLADGARVQTWEEAQGQFFKDIGATFGVLGSIIGFIGLIVASITLFIVIFVNAVTRRKFIGILKGIGISSKSIEISYMFQSVFYSVAGSSIGLVILYGFLQPFITAHPINFPFSDGILVAPLSGTLLRMALLVFATIIAGFIPARLIVKQNTLDSILGR